MNKKIETLGYQVFFTYNGHLYTVTDDRGEARGDYERHDGGYLFEDLESAKEIFKSINKKYLKNNGYYFVSDVNVWIEESIKISEFDEEGDLEDEDFEYKKILEKDFYYAGN